MTSNSSQNPPSQIQPISTTTTSGKFSNSPGKLHHPSGYPVASGKEISFIREGSTLIFSFIQLMRLLKLTTKYKQASELRIGIKENMMKKLIRKLV